MSSRSTGVDGVRVGAIARILCVTKYAVKSAAAAWRERGEEVKEAHAGANGGCATGVLHSLLGIDSAKALLSNPRYGASWEGLIIEEILSRTMHTEAYWWSTHQGVEIDLVLFHKGKRYGVEVKRTDAPSITPSIRIAQETLGLTRVSVVTPGIAVTTCRSMYASSRSPLPREPHTPTVFLEVDVPVGHPTAADDGLREVYFDEPTV